MKYKTFLPVLIDITDKKILVIGGGKVAAHKILSILRFKSNITVLAPVIIEQIKKDTRLHFIHKTYEKEDLNGYHFIYACTNNREVNSSIKNDANALGLLVNVADDPDLCDFISPAIYKDHHITVAVSSNGQDVKKAIQIRDRIETIFENEN